MSQPPTLFRGRVSIRPWRFGLLIDIDDDAQVREAIAAYTGVWGGIYLLILNRPAPTERLRNVARLFDLDSLYATNAEGDLEELLLVPNISGADEEGRGPLHHRKGACALGCWLQGRSSPTSRSPPGMDLLQMTF